MPRMHRTVVLGVICDLGVKLSVGNRESNPLGSGRAADVALGDEVVLIVETVAKVGASWPQNVASGNTAQMSDAFIFPATPREFRDTDNAQNRVVIN